MGGFEVGDALPELRVTPDKYLPHRYAGASGDFNPIHIDPEFARAVGLPGNILHGLWGMAQVTRAAVVAAGGGRTRAGSVLNGSYGPAPPMTTADVRTFFRTVR